MRTFVKFLRQRRIRLYGGKYLWLGFKWSLGVNEDVELHSEVMRRAHLPLLRKLPITMVDYGQDPHVTPQDALRSGFKTSWHFRDLELLNGTPESIRALYRSYAASGLEGIVLSLVHRGIPMENIKALLTVAREYA